MPFTVMTYNVHGCVGLDRKCSPERIARVIANRNPDIIAMQELDISRVRSGRVDQPARIAELLEMTHHFYATMQEGDGHYGGAILSRFPIRKIKNDLLPAHTPFEPRGALWVEVDYHGRKINFINTHLGLRNIEHISQVDALLGGNWCKSEGFCNPGIICGDFNFGRRSPHYKKIIQHLRDVRADVPSLRPAGTWMGITTLDHIFVTPGIKVEQVKICSTVRTRVASDHLPLFAQLELE